MLVTGTDDPLTEVGLRALPGETLELTVHREYRTLSDERDLYLFFVAAHDGRAKGLEALSFDDDGAADRLRLLLDNLPEDDLAVLLVPRLRERARHPIGRVLAAAGLEPAAGDTRRLVAAWRKGGDPARARRWEQPRDGAAWKVELARL